MLKPISEVIQVMNQKPANCYRCIHSKQSRNGTLTCLLFGISKKPESEQQTIDLFCASFVEIVNE